jgi:hypothetical protein
MALKKSKVNEKEETSEGEGARTCRCEMYSRSSHFIEGCQVVVGKRQGGDGHCERLVYFTLFAQKLDRVSRVTRTDRTTFPHEARATTPPTTPLLY